MNEIMVKIEGQSVPVATDNYGGDVTATLEAVKSALVSKNPSYQGTVAQFNSTTQEYEFKQPAGTNG